ncbi:FAD/NAD(P)-binding domain-containing protein [Ophiobolus disseminans]|uniref:FAD/NAD(P)-binding domain-containing protein n=1 Tax=Ophiobolus disseminans TaxID=1469910 RepID=A0A6A7A550_9PLEO|nr:FAD/NAD(P)-binding domain-containing protein [Ophiobolus disseminans]
MEKVDLVIVGAGIFGLTNAATYHRLHPQANVIILDAAPCIGGPWALHRIFPGLKTNNLLGMFEHPDFPMDEEKFGVRKGEHIPAEKVLQYLKAFADGSDITAFLRLSTKVEVIRKDKEQWELQCTSLATGSTYSITTPKLIVAVGNTNKPKMPSYPTSGSFQPPVVHSKDFPAHHAEIVKPNTHTLVIGGGKSAWDVSYACATQPNATATILICPSGNGPNWLTPTHVTPFTLWLEKLVFTRFFGYMSPCPWASTTGLEGWIRAFLHGTGLGRKVVAAFWKVLGDDAIALNKLYSHPETAKLVPWRGAFEVANCLSIHNYPTDFFDLVREGRIRVMIDEVQSLEAEKEVLLKSGVTLQVDAVVCATGWKVGQTLRFEPESLEKALGLPTTRPPTSDEASFIETTSASLLTQYPSLKRSTTRTNHIDPSLRSAQPPISTHQPYRLHRFIVPPTLLLSRSIAFSGAMYSLGTFPLAYIQSLWIGAYLSCTLPLPQSAHEVVEDMYRDTQYCVLRSAGGYGRVAPDIVFDSLPYFDVLLRDLGLDGRRKGGGVGEVWRSYGPEDYRGLVGEWMQGESKKGEKYLDEKKNV